MENEKMYLIHEDDYLRHIDEKLCLYRLIKQLAAYAESTNDIHKLCKLGAYANFVENRADELFESFGIPEAYMMDGDIGQLAELMDNELLPLEEAGFIMDEDGEDETFDYYDDDYDDYDDDELPDEASEIGELLCCCQSILAVVESQITRLMEM